MPFLLPAAATAVAAAAPAAAATTAAATAGATLTSIATNIAMNVAISAVMSALQPNVGAAGRSSEWTLSPDGPIPFAAGRIGVAGSVVHRATFGPDLMYLGVPAVLSGAGPIDGYESFRADDEFVTFDANGKAVSSQYAGELWFKRTFGNQPDVAITSPAGLKNGTTLSGWSTAHKLSGKAAYMVVMGENSKGTAFPTGEIKPLIVFRGLRGWDPRLDSTWPGGVGPCRLNDPSTWVYLRRPGLWGLKWSLGLWEDPVGKGAPQVGTQVGGIGAKLSGIDVQAFINLENICDANDWTVCGYPTTDDDKFAVLESFLQAGGATFAMRAGKISCIQRAAPRTSIVTIGAGDTAGPLEIDTAASRIDRINTIRPRIISENHRWQLTAITEVTAQTYRDQDGGTRPRGIDYTYVSNATQGAQLAGLQIANTREGIAGVIPLKPHLQKIKPGDAFTITEPGFVLNGLKCLCLTTDFDPTTKIVAVSFVSETDAKYPFALGQSQVPPEPPVLEPVDPRYVSPPGETEWEIVARPPAEGGAQVPGFDLVGEVDNATATALLVEWGPTADGPWTQAYLGPPTAERIPITGVQPNAVYYVSTMNIREQNYSQRRVFGPFTAPPLVSNDTVNVGDMPAGDVADAASQVPTLALTLAGAQSTIATHQATLYQATTGLVDRVAALVPAVFDPVTGLGYRMGQAETAILANNAAAVSRLSAVEAKTNANANLIANPSGREGLNNWVQGNSAAPFTAEAGQAWGNWFRTLMTGRPNGTTSSLRTKPIVAGFGANYTLTGKAFLYGISSGFADVSAYGYTDDAGTQGETHLGGTNLVAVFGQTPGQVNLPTKTFGTGANIRSIRIWFQVSGNYGPYADFGAWNLKLEAGNVATVFTDDMAATDLHARSVSLETAVVDLAAGKADVGRVTLLEAQVVGASPLPSSFNAPGAEQYFAVLNNTDGAGAWAAITPLTTANLSTSAEGRTFLTTGANQLYQRGVLPRKPNQKVRITALIRYISIGGSGTDRPILYLRGLNTAYAHVAGGTVTAQQTSSTVVSTFRTISMEVDTSTLPAAVAYMRAGVYAGTDNTSTWQVLELRFEDVTATAALAARASTLENAVTDLQTGKASVLSVTQLEARVGINPNLLKNPSGKDGRKFWDFINEPFDPKFDGAWGNWFAHRFDGQSDHYATMRSQPFRAGYGGTYTMSGELYQSGMGGAYADIGVYGYTNDAGTQGEVRLSPAYNTISVHNPNAGRIRLNNQTFVAPANVVAFRIWAQLRVTGPGGYSEWGFWNLKIEPGATATRFSDEASEGAISTTVTTTASALATLEGRMEGRLIFNVQAGNQIVGGQFLAVDGPDASYSTLDWWAGTFRVSNNGLNPTAPFVVRDNQVRIQELLVDRVAVGASIVVGSRRLALAVQPFPVSVTDGVPISYGYNIGLEPTVVFLRDGAIQTPGSAESYDFTAEASTGNGFTPRLKIKTASAPANVTHGPGGHSSSADAEFYYTLNGGRANTTVNVRSTGVIQYQWVNNRFDNGHIPEYEEQPGYEWDRYTEGYLVLQTRIFNGSVWRDGPPIEVYPPPLNSGTTGLRTSAYDTGDVAITVNPGDTRVGIKLAYESHAGSYVSDLRLGYQTAGASGVRSATPNGELTTAMIYPRNAA